MAKVSSTFMKFFIVLVLLLIGLSAVVNGACIKNGGRCVYNAGPPYCCSNFCNQIAGQSYGTCQKS